MTTSGLEKTNPSSAIQKAILVGSLTLILSPLIGNAQPKEMMMKEDFTTTITVDQSPKDVFTAINNVRSWWQGEITGNTNNLQDEFIYRMEDIHYSKQKIVEVIPDKKVVWLVTESKLNFAQDKSEWTGTKIIFEITQVGNKTQLHFTHSGLVPKFECYKNCSNAWEQLVQESLYSLITTGKGKKVFSK